jgi:site-specific DNA-methyltransferase (adenine-specific)
MSGVRLNTITCGDYRDYISMVDKSCIVITDPPYGINYNPNWKKWNGSKSNFTKIQEDDSEIDPTAFLSFAAVVLWGANHYSKNLPYSGWLCWDKRVKENCDKMFGRPFELAWWSKSSFKICRLQHGGVVNADSEFGNNAKRFHPTQKPIKLMQWCIELISKPGDTIFDPFIGSGTTALACINTGRNYIGIEKEEKYCRIAEERIRALKGA